MDNAPYAQDLLNEYTPQQLKQTKLRDEALYVLAQTSGWSELKKIVEAYITTLEELNIDPKDTVETVGYKYLASRTAKQYLQMVISIVEDTHNAVEQSRSGE